MLYSAVVNFKAQGDAVVSPTQGYRIHAMFLDMLRQASPDAAQEFHDLDGAKPFTVSPLQGRLSGGRLGLKLTEGQTYWVRFTVLEEKLFAYLLDALLKASTRTLRLDQAALRIDEVLTRPGASPLCRCQGFDSILEAARAERQVHLRFLSATAFRSGGKRNVLFPEPRLLFNSYLTRWQSFSPVKLDDRVLEVVDRGTRIARYKLETRILDFGSYQEVGFEGTCTIEVAEEVPEQTVRCLNALADFAFYCGTGAKTAMGMGQTHRLFGSRRSRAEQLS